MVGAHLTCSMLKLGIRVRATKCKCDDIQKTKTYLSHFSDDYENLFNEIEWVDACSKDLDSMLDAMEGIDVVFDCERPYISAKHNFQSNIDEIRNIITAVADAEVNYFYYLSSLDALGDEPDCKEITELSQRNPKGKYSKISQLNYLCEMEVQRAFNEGLKGGIVNPGVILGPGDWKNDSSRIFSFAAHNSYYTKGVTAFVGIDDVVKCLMLMARTHITGEKFILFSQCLSYLEVLNMISRELGKKPPHKYVNHFRMFVYKVCYALKSLFVGRRPIIDAEYFGRLDGFKLYSNTKSKGRIIIDFEPIDQVVKDISDIYMKDSAYSSKNLTKFA